jgi:hypothetical protein
MSDDTTAGSGQHGGAVEHQSIVSRILEYQRQLREGDPPPPPVETLPDRPLLEFVAAETLQAEAADLVDLTEAEAALAADAEPSPEVTAEPAPEAADEGARADEPAEAEEEEQVAPVVRLEVPASHEPATSGVWAIPEPPARPERNEAAERLAELEESLRHVSETIAELRQRFQDMAVASDERLAELEQIVERARRSARV